MVEKDTKVSICGVELDNPVIPASGTFGCREKASDKHGYYWNQTFL